MHTSYKYKRLAITYEENSSFAAKNKILLLFSPLSHCQNTAT